MKKLLCLMIAVIMMIPMSAVVFAAEEANVETMILDGHEMLTGEAIIGESTTGWFLGANLKGFKEIDGLYQLPLEPISLENQFASSRFTHCDVLKVGENCEKIEVTVYYTTGTDSDRYGSIVFGDADPVSALLMGDQGVYEPEGFDMPETERIFGGKAGDGWDDVLTETFVYDDIEGGEYYIKARAPKDLGSEEHPRSVNFIGFKINAYYPAGEEPDIIDNFDRNDFYTAYNYEGEYVERYVLDGGSYDAGPGNGGWFLSEKFKNIGFERKNSGYSLDLTPEGRVLGGITDAYISNPTPIVIEEGFDRMEVTVYYTTSVRHINEYGAVTLGDATDLYRAYMGEEVEDLNVFGKTIEGSERVFGGEETYFDTTEAKFVYEDLEPGAYTVRVGVPSDYGRGKHHYSPGFAGYKVEVFYPEDKKPEKTEFVVTDPSVLGPYGKEPLPEGVKADPAESDERYEISMWKLDKSMIVEHYLNLANGTDRLVLEGLQQISLDPGEDGEIKHGFIGNWDPIEIGENCEKVDVTVYYTTGPDTDRYVAVWINGTEEQAVFGGRAGGTWGDILSDTVTYTDLSSGEYRFNVSAPFDLGSAEHPKVGNFVGMVVEVYYGEPEKTPEPVAADETPDTEAIETEIPETEASETEAPETSETDIDAGENAGGNTAAIIAVAIPVIIIAAFGAVTFKMKR